MKPFRDWLLAYDEDDVIGDLAQDVKRQPPPGDWTANSLRSYLVSIGVGEHVMEAFYEACNEYAATVAKTTPPL